MFFGSIERKLKDVTDETIEHCVLWAVYNNYLNREEKTLYITYPVLYLVILVL